MRNQTLICLRSTMTDLSKKKKHQRCQYKTISAFGCFTIHYQNARAILTIVQNDDDDGDEEEIYKLKAEHIYIY